MDSLSVFQNNQVILVCEQFCPGFSFVLLLFPQLIEKSGHYAAMTQEHEFHISPVVILEKLVAVLLVISPLLWIFSLLLSFSIFILFQASRKAHAEYFFSKLTENPWQYIAPREGKDELHSDSAEEELVAKETHNIDNDSTGKN